MKTLMIIGAGIVLGVILDRLLGFYFRTSANKMGDEIKNTAEKEAQHILQEAKLGAKEEMIAMREEFEKAIKDRRDETKEQEARLNEREANIERKMDFIQNRQDEVIKREKSVELLEKRLRQQQSELEEIKKKEMVRLEGVAMMTRDQARVQIMQKLEQELVNERGTMIRKSVEEVKQKCKRDAQKLIVEAMQRCAGEVAYERTTSTVSLPSDDMKGRIIGRDGRNIRVFEAETGVNVLIDDTPSAVVITCFEPIRLHIARLAMEKLVEDGRIHPTRVEEVVVWAKNEISSEIIKAGEDAIHELQLAGVPPQVIEVLGKLKYRYSYSQNVLQHSIQVARFMGSIAGELSLNIDNAKRMGLFHDIGKALDQEIEGPHAIIGKEFLKRAGEAPEILNGVGCHHGDIPAETPLASLVSVCDAISAGRPGARSETNEFYIKRLEQLEEIGNSFAGVECCYAVQAGREIRVIVEPDKISEHKAYAMAKDLVKRIESEMQYPGQIKICVIRETRTVEYAK